MRRFAILLACSLARQRRLGPGADPAGRAAAPRSLAPAEPLTQAQAAQDIAAAPGTSADKRADQMGRRRAPRPGPRRRHRHDAAAPGCRSTSRPTGARSPSTCSATSTSCRSAAARRARSPPAMPGTCSRATRPTGSEIAFTSDRGGGDNIWAMDRDGSAPRQITKEDFRLLNQADWTPDGNYHRRAQAFHLGALAGRGRDVALPPHRRARRRRPDDQGADQAEGHQRAGLLARRPLPLFLRRRDARRHVRIFEGRQRPDLRHPAARPADRRDRILRHRPRRRDPPDALARRQELGLHPPHPLQIDPDADGHRLRADDRADRHPRPRHAGNLGDPRRLSGDQLDPRQPLDRLLGGRRAPPHRRRQPRGQRHPVPRRRHALRRGRGAPAEGRRARPLRREDGPLRPGQPRRPPRRL